MAIKAITNVSTFVKKHKTLIVRTTLIATGIVSGIIAADILSKKYGHEDLVAHVGETVTNLTPDIPINN